MTGGGDWLLVGPDGMGRLDARAQIETHDNAVLDLTYEGVIEMNERVQTALAEGAETAYEDQYFRTTPRLETGDERYAWVNQTVLVGQGRIYPGSERAVPRLPRQLRHWEEHRCQRSARGRNAAFQ